MSTSSAPRRELPGGKTIAHGLLTLSLMPSLAAQTLKFASARAASITARIKSAFPRRFKCGVRLRLHRRLERFEPVEGGARLTFSNIMEIEGEERPGYGGGIDQCRL
jgi:acyl dehydratase